MSKELTSQTPATSTPSSHWRAEGAPDPHAGHYDGERATLAMGKLTDDELANGAFMNYDQPLNLDGIIAGTHSSPIAWMTAVKDRIRWLSRSLEGAAAERDALAAELKALREQEPETIDWPNYHHDGMGCGLEDRGITDRYEAMRHGWDCAMSSMAQLLPEELYANPVPARELTDEAIENLHMQVYKGPSIAPARMLSFARAIERYLKGVSENG